MENDYRIRLNLRGIEFERGPSLSDSIEILKSFSDVYSYCLNRGTRKFAKEELLLFEPTLKLEYAKKGSFDAISWIDFPASYAMIQPLVGDYSWSLFKNTFEFVRIVVSKYLKKKENPSMIINDSPGSQNILVVGNNNVINVGYDIFESAKRNYPSIGSLARRIGGNGKSKLAIARIGERKKTLEAITVTPQNRTDYIAEPHEFVSDDTINIIGNIYKLNKKSGFGMLEVFDEEISERTLPFEIIEEQKHRYADALRLDKVTVTAKPKMFITPFGEHKITYLYLIGIQI